MNSPTPKTACGEKIGLGMAASVSALISIEILGMYLIEVPSFATYVTKISPS